jgi:single-strand DNA-binding protein
MPATTTISGNLVEDPTFGTTKAGFGWTRFRIAQNTGRGDSERTDYYTVKVFSSEFAPNFAQNVAESCKKGMRVEVTGRVSSEAWQSKDDGSIKSALVITADDVKPSLRFASAVVTKNPREGGSSQGYGNRGVQAGGGYARTEASGDDMGAFDPFSAGDGAPVAAGAYADDSMF